ncbi:MAG: M23 family metallopeptidase [Candidatus Cloacimonadaceae bacterium]|nr:M23 family metallopeptidase [Candidatus Cloacimonadota bacterium]MDY0128268.1 M23 family metallopeptidase [Candidatus Cloacimonadaceae bacterium]MCB5254017.1 M23 family metallopeptidase [Candidatus Cloacimonadota bacterium]MCK9178895.1 M23 family metallopeptidase [Candidatus Cloacimonadota bacterium]MCK9242993.1 M23 family metallopeptidase [Candidatus Cloacimonadota bacterium]
MKIDKERNSELRPEGLGLGEPAQDKKRKQIYLVAILLLLFVAVGILSSHQGGRFARSRIQSLEEENQLLRAKVEQYATTVDSIYNMLDSLGLTHKDKRDYPYYSGGATENIGYSRDPRLKLEMEGLERKLSEILAYVEPKFPSLQMTVWDGLQPSGDVPSIYPTFGRISDGWGSRIHPITKNLEFHHGIDISNQTGTPIYATASGVVEKTRYTRGYGKHVVIDHGNGYKSLYAHLYNIKIKKGESVSKGQIIGLMGDTGYSTGPHLHYEVQYNQHKLNPANFLNRIEEYASR